MKLVHLTSKDRSRPSAASRHAIMLAGLLLIFLMAGGLVAGQSLSQADIVKLQESFNAANALLNSGDAQSAVQKYGEAIGIAPAFPLPYLNRAVAYVSLAKHAEALADADKALALLESGASAELMKSANVPKYSAIAYQIKGTVQQNTGDYSTAVQLYSKSVELDPTDAKFRNNRGNALRLLKQYAEAMKDYDAAIELDPKIGMIYVNRASVHLILKNLDAALRDSEQAVKLDANDDSAYYTRGNTYVELKKFAEAAADLDRAISLKPKSEYFHARARMHFLQNKFDLAVKDHTEAIARNSTNANAYADRAVAYSRLGKNAEAIGDIRKALELRSDSVLMRYTLGYLLFKTGQFAAATTEATKVIAAAPKWRDAYILRANCYAKLGNVAKAKADNDAASRLPAGNRPVEDINVFEMDILVQQETQQ